MEDVDLYESVGDLETEPDLKLGKQNSTREIRRGKVLSDYSLNYILKKFESESHNSVSIQEQVSLAIRRCYFPDKFQTADTKTDILGLK